MTEWEDKKVLAYRIYPQPGGTNYYIKDLINTKKIKEIFDYCQILEVVILKDGWDFLINHFGYEILYKINKDSGWFDSADLEEFIVDLEAHIGQIT